MTPQELKIAAAREALSEVRSGMTLGLGTGTTADEFVKLLGAALAAGTLKDLRCTSTSEKTADLARSVGITILPLANVAPLDLAIDGTDEIDSNLRLIKGRGGALLREKIVEQQARRFIVIADESKIVKRLGAGTLPVEVTPFAIDVLMRKFSAMNLRPARRMAGAAPRLTDEGNGILDVMVPAGMDIAEVAAEIRGHAGVVETGFFPTEATEAVIASAAGIRRMRR